MKAIEAAWQKVMSARDMPRDDDPNYDRWLFEASIKEFCTALSEDDAAVERVARAICESEGLTPDETAYTDEMGSKLQWETYTHTARAAIRAMGGK